MFEVPFKEAPNSFSTEKMLLKAIKCALRRLPKYLGIGNERILKTYSSYEKALYESHTYEDPDIVRTVFEKTKILHNSLKDNAIRWVHQYQTSQNMFVLTLLDPHRPLHVLELGGACGATYMELTHLLSLPIGAWHIVESRIMVETARSVFEDETLRFYFDLSTGVADLAERDLLFAQGVLQYTPDPIKTWMNILDLNFSHVYLTRTHVSDGLQHPVITVAYQNLSQHGPGCMPNGLADKETSQPLTIVPLEQLLDRIPDRYRVLYMFDEGSRILETNSVKIPGKIAGLLLKKVS